MCELRTLHVKPLDVVSGIWPHNYETPGWTNKVEVPRGQ